MDDLLSTRNLSAAPDLVSRFSDLRSYTESLIDGLSAEDCQIQSMPDASPAKWHLAHTTWFWETFLLPEVLPSYKVFDDDFGFLFNSYYEAIGPRHTRSNRGMITRPGLDRVLDYRRSVTDCILEALEKCGNDLTKDQRVILEIGIAHEEQHQELLLTDIKHALFQNPVFPAFRSGRAEPAEAGEAKWISFDRSISHLGHDGKTFAFDNEFPRHEQLIRPFQLASRLVTNQTVLEFVADGGYQTSSLWLFDGWAKVCDEGRRAPLYWLKDDNDGWSQFTLHGRQPIDPNASATHLDFYEANAIADWCEARLPTEFEWEHAATTVESLEQLFGHCWQWTRSDYSPYPGYHIPQGAIGEYNGKFMSNQYVLRGSSSATTPGHERVTYRNFFPAGAQWQFTGLRLARDFNR